MKNLLIARRMVVEEMFAGCRPKPCLARLSGHKVMFRADAEQIRDKQVAVISVVAAA